MTRSWGRQPWQWRLHPLTRFPLHKTTHYWNRRYTIPAAHPELPTARWRSPDHPTMPKIWDPPESTQGGMVSAKWNSTQGRTHLRTKGWRSKTVHHLPAPWHTSSRTPRTIQDIGNGQATILVAQDAKVHLWLCGQLCNLPVHKEPPKLTFSSLISYLSWWRCHSILTSVTGFHHGTS